MIVASRFLATVFACVAGCLALASSQPAPAAGSEAVMFLVDVSGSMGDDDGTGRVKIDGAKVALLDHIEGLPGEIGVGLRTYPNQNSGASCNSGDLVRAPTLDRDDAALGADIRRLFPDGDTPTAEALLQAADDMDTAGMSGTIVLVSDGESTCEPPCEAAETIAGRGLDIQMITVGFRISDSGRSELRCIADAMHGRYVDVSDNAELTRLLTELARPKLEVELAYTDDVIAGVGDNGSGNVTIRATVQNTSDLKAANVRLRMAMSLRASYSVLRPTRSVGNLSPAASRDVTWNFRPSTLSIGDPIAFTVFAYGDNVESGTSVDGEIVVRGNAAAGEILGEATGKLAILGDSFSSGEGADEYVDGTDVAGGNHCHRSLKTYLAPQLRLNAEKLIACSGAVATDITHPNTDNGVPSQVQQLAKLVEQDPDSVNGVIMTLGGNDFGFADLIKGCMLSIRDCSETFGGQAYISDTVAAVQDDLAGGFRYVNGIVNREDVVKRRQGRLVPILVTAYPLITPLVARSSQPTPGGGSRFCASNAGFNQAESAFLTDVGSALNGTVEAAVLAARDSGAPVFFVDLTELAFFPDNTICSSRPFVRALESFNGVAVDWAAVGRVSLALAITSYPPLKPLAVLAKNDAKEVGKEHVARATQELFHPNQEGYAALSYAILRWSNTDDASAAVEFTRNAIAADGRPPGWRQSDVNLGQIQDGAVPTLQAGDSYQLTVDGFGPGTPARIVINSTPRTLGSPPVEEGGQGDTRIVIPVSMERGAHTVQVIGVDEDSTIRTVDIPVEVAGGRPSWFWLAASGGMGTLLLIVGLALRRIRPGNCAVTPAGRGNVGALSESDG